MVEILGGPDRLEGENVAGIEITCRGADSLPLDAIEEFQGNLKKRTAKDIGLIVKSIEKYGFSFPFFVWNGSGHNYCLDGHGRIQALCEMRKRGVSLPLFPVAYIDAKDEAEAKQKLLRLNSQYGQMSIDSVMEFTEGLEVDFGDLSLPGGALYFETSNSEIAHTQESDTKEIDVDGYSMGCRCPRCGFEFNPEAPQ